MAVLFTGTVLFTVMYCFFSAVANITSRKY